MSNELTLDHYHSSKSETARLDSLLSLIPPGISTLLDIGARDGFITRKLADRVDEVSALDLRLPEIDDQRIQCVQGDAQSLTFASETFEMVFCAEVLEHIPTHLLAKVCSEMVRVTRRYVLIGVPYRQDIRLGRTTCLACGGINPPWGHVNSFDANRLMELFSGLMVAQTSFVGQSVGSTNAISAMLLNWAGNPYGTYEQEEACVYCDRRLVAPPERTVVQKVATKFAVSLQRWQNRIIPKRGNWIHMLFAKSIPGSP